jgi:NhaP-type Na+/H+ or K+/H+ antiporter
MKLPTLIGMLLTGIVLGPYVLSVLDPKLLSISADLRRIALVIILTRAGLALNLKELKKVGRPAFLMCFIPASLELIGTITFAPLLLPISLLEAAIMGTVIAAVSPAVIVPKMLKIMEEKYGTAQSIPQMILAGASVDDVFVIVLFTVFTGLAQGGEIMASDFLQIPISIGTGIFIGIFTGLILVFFFQRYHMRDTIKVVILLSFAFLLLAFEEKMKGIIAISGLLAIMSIGITLLKKYQKLALRLSTKFTKLWVAAEILLFVLVGATVDIHYAFSAGLSALLVIVIALAFRMLGVALCLIGTSLHWKERLFCMIAYLPKATVQAAIGGIPLAMGLPCGKLILTVAVLSILITAPLGAFGVETTYKKWLQKEK